METEVRGTEGGEIKLWARKVRGREGKKERREKKKETREEIEGR